MSTNWITLSQTAGTGNQVVTVSAVTNEVMSERNLRIKITTGGKTEYVFVTQDAAPLMVTRIEFTGCQFPPISYTGGTLTASDGRYNITAYYNDGSVVPQVPATVTGSFSSSAINVSLSVVSAGTMNLTASFSGKSASTTYTVMQMGVPEGRYIEYSGNSQVNVSGNWSSTGTTNVIANSYSGGSGLIVFDNVADYIPTEAFANQTGLTWVVLPSTIDEISSDVFSGCSSLTTIGYNGTMDEFKALPKASTWRDNSAVRFVQCTDGIIDLESNKLITYLAANKLPDVTGAYDSGLHYQNFVPALSTNNHTFDNGVGKLTFTSDVTQIGNKAFYKCSGMTEVIIPSTVTSIGSSAFEGCSNLTSIILPTNLTEISAGAFYRCTGLISVVVPSGVTYLSFFGLGAFEECSSLSSLTLPNTIESLGPNEQFSGCTSLETITFQGTKSEWYNIANYPNFKNYSSIRYVQCNDGLIDYNENVIYVTYGSTDTGKTLSGSVVASAFTTTPYFNDNTSPRKISFDPNHPVTLLSEGCFKLGSDYNFKTISLPTTIQTISANAFGNSVYNRAITSRYINYQGTKAQWNNINITDSLAVIDKIVCTDGNIYVREPIVFTYKATAKLPETTDTETTTTGIHIYRPWPNGSWSEYEHTYNGGNNTGVLSYVGNFNQIAYMFIKCNAMYEIEMPSQVTVIGAGTFSGCTFLEDVVLPDTITNINTWAFRGCIMLGELTYKGTKAQWNNVTLGQLWNDESSISVIHCTDGDINI